MNKLHFPKGSNKIAFFFSCFFVCYGLMNISDQWWIKIVMVSLGLYIEYEVQYILGLSNTYKKLGRPSWWLRGIYIGYIIIFGLFSGIGFFATEISVQESAAEKVESIETNNQSRINQLNRLIETTTNRIDNEYNDNHGIGPNYQQMQRELDNYNRELQQLLVASKTVITVEKKTQIKDMFANLSKVLHIPKEVLIIFMFGYALSIVYIALTIKPVEIPTAEIVPDEILLNTPEPAPVVKVIKKYYLRQPKRKLETEPKTEPVTALPKLYEVKPIVSEVPIKKEMITDSVSKVVAEPEKPKVLSIKQEKLIKFAEHVYTDNPNRLNGLTPAWNKLREHNVAVTYRECADLMAKLNEIGAINTEPGNTKANWPLERTIEYIKNMKEMEG